MLAKLLKSKFFRGLLVIGLVLVLAFLGRELKARYEIREEIRQLQAEIKGLEGKNQETKLLIDYFRTQEYQERQARSLLSLQKPGEFAVVLPFQESSTSTRPETDDNRRSNFAKWWKYFFGNEK